MKVVSRRSVRGKTLELGEVRLWSGQVLRLSANPANADRGRKKMKGGTSSSAFIHLRKAKLSRTECFVLPFILSR